MMMVRVMRKGMARGNGDIAFLIIALSDRPLTVCRPFSSATHVRPCVEDLTVYIILLLLGRRSTYILLYILCSTARQGMVCTGIPRLFTRARGGFDSFNVSS